MRLYRLYILDLDGTLYRGEEPTPHAVATVAKLRDLGAKIRFLTNNSGRTRQFYANKLNRLGFEAAPEEVYSSALGTARWCRENQILSAFVVGEEGLVQELADEQIRVTNLSDYPELPSWLSGELPDRADAYEGPVGLLGPSHQDKAAPRREAYEGPVGLIGADSASAPRADAVVVGICRRFTYDWMNRAMQEIRGGAQFVATNPDVTYPLEQGRLEPGAGSIVAAVAACSEREPHLIGKPNPYLTELILRESETSPEEALVVGDRPETDLECGRRAGCATHLVLCGITERAQPGQPHSADLSGLLPS
jgi:4-nitrophenyl phosphatase